MRRVLLVLVCVSLVFLAGCTGVPSDDGDLDETLTGTPEATETDEEPGDANGAIETSTEETPTASDEDDPPTRVDGHLEVHHIDVGQADATLIITPANETILIDSGDWRQGGTGVIEYLEAEGVDRIDHLVATHAHADHIGGHDRIIEWAETEGAGIGAAYDSGVPTDTATYGRYLDAIEDYNVELFIVEEGDELPLEGDVEAHVLNPPEGDSGTNLHHNSVVLAFEFGDFGYLTTGDAEQYTENRLIEKWYDRLDADVYQVGHHGSSTSSTDPFLDAVAPEIAVISSAYESRYGHPHDEVLEAFADREIETYWTGVHGDVVVETNGSTVTVTTTEEFSTDPADILAEKPNDGANAISTAHAPRLGAVAG